MKPTRINQAPEWEWWICQKKMIIFFRETPADQIFWQQLINIIFTPNWYARLARSSLKLAK